MMLVVYNKLNLLGVIGPTNTTRPSPLPVTRIKWLSRVIKSLKTRSPYGGKKYLLSMKSKSCFDICLKDVLVQLV